MILTLHTSVHLCIHVTNHTSSVRLSKQRQPHKAACIVTLGIVILLSVIVNIACIIVLPYDSVNIANAMIILLAVQRSDCCVHCDKLILHSLFGLILII